jgi:hypothetical protein
MKKIFFWSYILLFAVSFVFCKKKQDTKGYLLPSGLENPTSTAKSMKKYQIKTFATINGVGAASGIVYNENNLYIVGDNSGFLYKYDINEKQLDKIPMFTGAEDIIIKKNKPDFESIYLDQNKLHIFGSGSTNKRNKKYIFDLQTKEVLAENIEKERVKFKEIGNLTNDELNIEGNLIDDNYLFAFQRGNGAKNKNGIFATNKTDKSVKFIPFQLPVISNIPTTFTDATIVDNVIYFLASAEDTSSTYIDGEILGSLVGAIDTKTMQLIFTQQIATKQKFEGITLYKKKDKSIHFLLCEDNDIKELKSVIYELIL